ncbi:histidine kinase dimerization/phosphoacceptor domain -containing protein [Mesobacterium pallidum]|uniref:histidine kinase dimerization/phosphoacceptor domain -containing protein n=1 Tax=Mesobacterium pallidum TaxID=2872037 RepID=UPI001EE29E7C|nr:histidine kinase dimerization/phosphoacceptor domain -containing protein [Mesobacterium pallidum]
MTKQTKVPMDEEVRLATLSRLGLLDTPAERDFDDICQLASEICGTPIALVSLVDRDRQFFKARVGIEATGTPRDQSVCATTMLGKSVFEIPDTTRDSLTATNPLVNDGVVDMKFYAGAPLTTSDGTPLGALCVIDREPRVLTEMQRRALEVLSRQVMAQIELRMALRESRDRADALTEALARESVLRGEVDHRVKNSLMQVMALLRLHANRTPNAEVKEELRAAEARVSAIAQIHEILHSSSGGTDVDIAEYFKRLAGNLRSTAPETVAITTAVPALRLATAQATSLALIANEFVTNSLKYAFPDSGAGTIKLELLEEASGVVARFTDDGIGHTGQSQGRGLGQLIMQAAAEQIGAVLDWLPGPGTHLEMRFASRLGVA